MTPRRRARRRTAALLLLSGLGTLAAGGLALSLVYDRPRAKPEISPRVPSRAELEAYEAAITEPAKRGGFVIQNGLKPGISQVAEGNSGPVVFQAVQWVASLQGVKSDFRAQARLTKGTALARSADQFDKALGLYINTAETIGAAAIASPGDSRETLLARAASSGQEADKAYDEASFVLQRLRKQRGLPPTARFPSPRSDEQ